MAPKGSNEGEGAERARAREGAQGSLVSVIDVYQKECPKQDKYPTKATNDMLTGIKPTKFAGRFFDPDQGLQLCLCPPPQSLFCSWVVVEEAKVNDCRWWLSLAGALFGVCVGKRDQIARPACA